MKNIIIAALLSIFIAAPAIAADGKNSIGVNYGLDQNGVFGFQGEFDISASLTNKAPVSVQVFWKNYSQSYFVPSWGTYQYSYNGFGAAAIYDFSSVAKLDKKIKPYAGVGLYTLNNTFSGPAVPFPTSADSGGLYITGGVRYALSPQVAADLNFNNIGGLTIGVNFSF
jgi:opacity protein-like surface antigen